VTIRLDGFDPQLSRFEGDKVIRRNRRLAAWRYWSLERRPILAAGLFPCRLAERRFS
jgi:hypothetical protein